MSMAKSLVLILIIFFLSISSSSSSTANQQTFDVRQHLSTVTSYGAVKDVADNSFVASKIPDECTPIHINLVARHGTRSPTKKRIKELDRLATRLEAFVSETGNSTGNVPGWLSGWKSPWKGKKKGGELVIKGEEELYQLGVRMRERFPDLFKEEYHPDIYTMKSSQIPRASASAVAFGMGLFNGKGTLGTGKHRAFAVTSESRASDLLLRFHDICQSYKNYRKSQEPSVGKLKEPILDEVASAMVKQYPMNFTRQDVASLWFLCKQEASLLDITDQACGLFTPSEVSLLEWADDLEAYILKGYGKSINYRMGVPLLQDVVQSMEEAIIANEENHPPGTYEKARLRFAHAETVVPFSCLLGLFRESDEYKRIQREKALDLPPKPPQKRSWRCSTVAPFAGNNMLTLYSCPSNKKSKYFVQVMHNEVPVPLPGCDNSDFCPFEDFKERIVNPHLGQDYHSMCSVKAEVPESNTFFSKLWNFIFPRKKNDAAESDVGDEL
ncbi:hypothetical protein C5167_030538 [Papaver somniferum]|uniref:multiple inositol polyphosphate phosphatase 1-like n=1 Tax=Papaver somniferum TaxID=3469 RepID=UPI000E6F57E4|nr:multiple inositol polyphosphate phosphatase 1-like [Papaver somniferum]RZC86462.1 hypothetical protein C5167_030538 [Papaver somniferum]